MRSECKRQFLKDNKANFALTLLSLFMASGMNILLAFMLKAMIEAMEGRNWDSMNKGLVMAGVCLVTFVIFSFIQKTYKNRFLRKALTQYKQHVFSRILEKPIGEFGDMSSGAFISGFSNDLLSIETNFLAGGVETLYQCIMLLSAIVAMIFINPLMTGCVLAAVLLPSIFTMLYGRRLTRKERETSDRNEGFVDQVKDLLGGFVEIKSFKAEKEVMKLFAKNNAELEDVKRSRRETNDTLYVVSTFSITIVITVIFGLGSMLVIDGVMTIGAVLSFVQLSNYLNGPIERIVPLWSNFRAAGQLVEKMERKIGEASRVSGKEKLDGFNDSISFRDVSYAYEEGMPALRDVSFEFRKGGSYAIVGGSGSGKTTMLKLMMGYYPDYKGSISIDGHELRNIGLGSLYDEISVIQQSVFLFDESIVDNITLFKDFPPEKVERAARMAGLSELIAAKGADYDCGEGGANLSGGEKQRVSIARCLVRETPVLMMDEATAALDNVTAESVTRAILDIRGLTRIIVTHKLEAALMRRYDSIIVMHKGEIAEVGSFVELMERKGYFYSLFNVSQ